MQRSTAIRRYTKPFPLIPCPSCLNDPRVAYVVTHHERWSKSRRAIARSLFIQGQSIRQVTDELGISFYTVRKHREVIDAMFQESSRSQPNRAWQQASRGV